MEEKAERVNRFRHVEESPQKSVRVGLSRDTVMIRTFVGTS